MDNIAHTLVGAAMAKAGLERLGPGSTAAIVLGANAPDVDIVAGLWSTGAYLVHHRGVTHSLSGTLLLTPLVAGAAWWLGRRMARRQEAAPGRARPAALPLCLAAFLGVASHLALDATNAYGVRPLLPFLDRWYYADWVPIVDPWVWLLPAAALYWQTGPGPRQRIAWAGLALLLSLPILVPGLVSSPVRTVWLAGLAATILGDRIDLQRFGPRVTRCALAGIVLYVVSTGIAHAAALSRARDAAPTGWATAVHPLPGHTGRWRTVHYGPDSVFVRPTRRLPGAGPVSAGRAPLRLHAPAARLAARTRDGRAMLSFARFPFARIHTGAEVVRVDFIDARYAWSGDEGWGVMRVSLPRAALATDSAALSREER